MTNGYLTVFIGILGLILGSFINVVALRDRKRSTIATGRSACPHCGHTLAWYDLIPLFSFLMTAGRCRYCKKPISWRYPVVELVSAALLAIIWQVSQDHFSGWLPVVGLSIAGLLLLAVSLIDLQSYEVPLDYVVAAGAIGAGFLLASGDLTLKSSLLGVLGGAGTLLFITYGWKLLFKKDGMGIGDAWIAGAIGATLGFPLVFAALLGAVFAGAIGGLLLIAVGKKDLGSRIPFGPFLALGWLLALVWGQALISWYILGL